MDPTPPPAEPTPPPTILLELPERTALEPRETRAAGDSALYLLAGVRAADVLVVILAAYLAERVLVTGEPPASTLVAALAGAALTLERLGRRQCYSVGRLRKLRWQLRQVAGGWATAFAVLVALAYLTRSLSSLSREWLWLWSGFGLVGLGGVRGAVWLLVRRASFCAAKVAVVGQGDPLAHFSKLALDRPGELELAAVVDAGDPAALAELERALRHGEVDEVVLALPWEAREQVAVLLGRLRAFAVNVRFFPYLVGLGLPMRGFVDVARVPLLRVYERPLSGWSLLWKNVFDRGLALVLLVLFAPVFLAVAVALKLTSPGPVFFRQRRWGFNGEEFLVFKFRSMHHRPVEEAQVVQATREDPRVSPVGRLLRKTSLDELPQLLNVLGGSMSLVGPRPHAVAHNETYGRIVDGYLSRHRVKPGMTGWAQIHGARGETDTPEKMRRRVEYDLQYIDRWSPLLDLKILVLTPIALLSGDAY